MKNNFEKSKIKKLKQMLLTVDRNHFWESLKRNQDEQISEQLIKLFLKPLLKNISVVISEFTTVLTFPLWHIPTNILLHFRLSSFWSCFFFYNITLPQITFVGGKNCFRQTLYIHLKNWRLRNSNLLRRWRKVILFKGTCIFQYFIYYWPYIEKSMTFIFNWVLYYSISYEYHRRIYYLLWNIRITCNFSYLASYIFRKFAAQLICI